MDMTQKKTWDEFRDAGLMWWINMILHTFGWAICFEPDTGIAYPARVKFRGFDIKNNDIGYEKMQKNFMVEKWHDKI